MVLGFVETVNLELWGMAIVMAMATHGFHEAKVVTGDLLYNPVKSNGIGGLLVPQNLKPKGSN